MNKSYKHLPIYLAAILPLPSGISLIVLKVVSKSSASITLSSIRAIQSINCTAPIIPCFFTLKI